MTIALRIVFYYILNALIPFIELYYCFPEEFLLVYVVLEKLDK